MPAPDDPIRLKSEVLKSIRKTLYEIGFLETVTPVMRRADLGPGRRVSVDHDGGLFLRAMIGPALRVNLEHHRRVFEIGPCFRPEKPDDLHACEFTMLDLYAADTGFDALFDIAEQLVGPYLPSRPVQVSVADHLRDVFDVDLRRQPIGELPHLIAEHLQLSPALPFKDVLGRYVELELEPHSAGAAIFLTDYPLGGDEPCARLRPGTIAVLNRFELIVDGIEVIHGYEDETDGAAFVQRAQAADLYDEEQRLAWAAIERGRVPRSSVGLGIGIERLCAVAAGVRDIRPFLQSPQF